MSVPQVETPMIRQFNAIKREHPDKILFQGRGNFYEMFEIFIEFTIGRHIFACC